MIRTSVAAILFLCLLSFNTSFGGCGLRYPCGHASSCSTAGTLWPRGVIPYALDDLILPDSWIAKKIERAIQHWESQTILQFVPYDPSQHKNYLVFEEQFYAGSSSWLGRQGGRQTIGISWYAPRGTIIHEIGHTIGLFHEHCRADREAHLAINQDNIEKDEKYQYAHRNHQGDKDYGNYDFKSIMHYSPKGSAINDREWVLARKTKGGNRPFKKNCVGLSQGDRAAVNQMYRVLVTQDSDYLYKVCGTLQKMSYEKRDVTYFKLHVKDEFHPIFRKKGDWSYHLIPNGYQETLKRYADGEALCVESDSAYISENDDQWRDLVSLRVDYLAEAD